VRGARSAEDLPGVPRLLAPTESRLLAVTRPLFPPPAGRGPPLFLPAPFVVGSYCHPAKRRPRSGMRNATALRGCLFGVTGIVDITDVPCAARISLESGLSGRRETAAAFPVRGRGLTPRGDRDVRRHAPTGRGSCYRRITIEQVPDITMFGQNTASPVHARSSASSPTSPPPWLATQRRFRTGVGRSGLPCFAERLSPRRRDAVSAMTPAGTDPAARQ
jgi:hypothetical protein